MLRISQRLYLGVAFLALGGCGSPQPPRAEPVGISLGVPEQLNRLVERYWDEHIPVSEVISPQALADSLSIERRYLTELNALSSLGLEANSRLTYDIFKRQREILIEAFDYPDELLPLGQFAGVLQSLEMLCAQAKQHSWSVADYQNWLKRLDEYVSWTQQAIQNMREGMRRGYISPRASIERSLALLERPGEDGPVDVCRLPLRAFPEFIGATDQARLKNTIADAVDRHLMPANLALRDFLRQEYLPRGRFGVAIVDLPLGENWYAYRIKRATGSTLSPDEIHAIGVAEVARLRSRLPPSREILQETLAGDELQSRYRDLITQAAEAMLPLFADSPDMSLEVRGTEWLTNPNEALFYAPGGMLGKPTPVLYVNIAAAASRAGPPMRLSIASFLQQALPGRHLQASFARQRLDLPRFRRMEDEPAFLEGWALYAASWGEQMGLLTDDASKEEALRLQLRCAVGLVVDTGLHAKGWSVKRALDYLQAESAIDAAGAQSLVDSYAAKPADALACKLGELKFAGLLAKAQQTLGNRFDIRGFHSEILKDGAMPLDVLEAKMKLWMEAPK